MSGPVLPANPAPCGHCPWRTANQGKKPDPHGFYTKANLKRLWSGMRHGERMSCHPTDPRMNEFEHAPPVKDGTQTHECTGALILQQREFMKYQAAGSAGTPKAYHGRSPHMSKYGLAEILSRAMGWPGTPMASPDLNQEAVGYAPLGDWKADDHG